MAGKGIIQFPSLMKKAPLFAALLAIAFVSTGPAAQAADACDFSAKARELEALQAAGALRVTSQRFQTELILRRELLAAAIACDQKDITARREVLELLPPAAKSLSAYQELIKGLEKAAEHYEGQAVGVQDLGLQGTKNASRALGAWRRDAYVPLGAWADNLILWADNQQFLERGSERLGQVSRLAFSLKLVDQDKTDEGIKKAQASFDAAFSENNKAREALNKGPAANVEALEHIKASLQALSDTYHTFFELQGILQRIVK